MFDRIRALLDRWHDLKSVDALSDRDLDDLGAIVMIALFYTKQLSLPHLAGSLAVWGVLLVLNRSRRVHALPPYLIGATVIGVLAQRLVRTLCPACKQPDEGPRAALDEAIAPWKLTGDWRPHRAVGCLECRHTGYRGRGGLYELLLLDDALQPHIHPQLDAAGLRQAAARRGLQPLRLAGAAKVAQGETTLDEVLRATPRWEA